MKHETNYKFSNWARNIRADIPHFYQPETEDELLEIIAGHRKIRLVGAAHSWNEICLTDEALVNPDNYAKILRLDKKQKRVTAQAGIRLSKLNELLDREGLALENLGSIAAQTLAGAVATGTHGTGKDFQILGSQIIEFSLLKANGEKIHISRETDPELFNAANLSLGCLGVVSEVTLQVTDAFNLHDRTETIPFEEVVENLEELLEENEHIKFWWLPPAARLIVYRYNRTDEKANDWRIRQFLKDEVSSVLFYRSLVKIAAKYPNFAPKVSRLMTRLFQKPLDRIEKSYKVFNVPEPPLHRETEWAFDLKRAREILTEYKKALSGSGFNFNFIQEIRFSKADDFWLSPCYRRDTLWIGFYNYEHENWTQALPFHEAFAKKFDGRPHWGKEFTIDQNYLRHQYERFDDFIALKNDLDPAGKFTNEFIGEIFKKYPAANCAQGINHN
jgi:L-gulono-1,4-lactone dehydrogenase